MTINTDPIRPAYWHGVDAGSFTDGCPIDWDYITDWVEGTAEETGLEGYDLKHEVSQTLFSFASGCRDRGNTEMCDWYASHGMALLNFY